MKVASYVPKPAKLVFVNDQYLFTFLVLSIPESARFDKAIGYDLTANSPSAEVFPEKVNAIGLYLEASPIA